MSNDDLRPSWPPASLPPGADSNLGEAAIVSVSDAVDRTPAVTRAAIGYLGGGALGFAGALLYFVKSSC